MARTRAYSGQHVFQLEAGTGGCDGQDTGDFVKLILSRWSFVSSLYTQVLIRSGPVWSALPSEIREQPSNPVVLPLLAQNGLVTFAILSRLHPRHLTVTLVGGSWSEMTRHPKRGSLSRPSILSACPHIAAGPASKGCVAPAVSKGEREAICPVSCSRSRWA